MHLTKFFNDFSYFSFPSLLYSNIAKCKIAREKLQYTPQRVVGEATATATTTTTTATATIARREKRTPSGEYKL